MQEELSFVSAPGKDKQWNRGGLSLALGVRGVGGAKSLGAGAKWSASKSRLAWLPLALQEALQRAGRAESPGSPNGETAQFICQWWHKLTRVGRFPCSLHACCDLKLAGYLERRFWGKKGGNPSKRGGGWRRGCPGVGLQVLLGWDSGVERWEASLWFQVRGWERVTGLLLTSKMDFGASPVKVAGTEEGSWDYTPKERAQQSLWGTMEPSTARLRGMVVQLPVMLC